MSVQCKQYMDPRVDMSHLRTIVMRDVPGCMISKVKDRLLMGGLHSSYSVLIHKRVCEIPCLKPGTGTLSAHNDTNCNMTVQSKHIKGLSIPYEDIIIAILEPGESIELELVATTGLPSDHVLYRHVTMCRTQGSTMYIETIRGVDPDEIYKKALDLYSNTDGPLEV